jgi:peptide subunit release factor 1 (eRF1)
VGIVVADRARAVLFAFEDGAVEQLAPRIEGDPGKPDFGGFEGYDEHGARARAEEEAARVRKAAAAVLFEAHRERPFDSLVIGGHKEDLDEVVAALHPYLRALPVEPFVIDPHTMTEAELRDRAAAHVERRVLAEDDALTARLLDLLGRGGDAVAGTVRVLEAANAKAIEHLVVSGTFARPGTACRRCGWLHRTATVCEVCGADMEPVDDAVAEAMEVVLASGGTVSQVRVASALDANGVGAFLRFPV